ncbi:TRAP transporter small permease [Ferrovibrio sp.]|uniref:TRAP transporter small permease n=1 Tax=Ferrovibrio sp. TaxID=1917215 RepID=UPI000CC58283|nr:TRAP transporter small permease subunit [Ferrovibrio sp.]PJI38528.1 MAG: C4-dicarboxylate ABC transporter permease [Ferrovibrio sp.]
MQQALRNWAGWFYRRGENILAAMLGAMFAVFIIQIVFRYLLNFPIGWTGEVSTILWVWLVLWGAAFVIREEEEIRFDLIYGAVRPRVRRRMMAVACVSTVVLYAVSFPATIDYVTFMKVEKAAYLKIRMDWLYSIYILFVAAVLVRYLWLSWQALRGKTAGDIDPTKAASGV